MFLGKQRGGHRAGKLQLPRTNPVAEFRQSIPACTTCQDDLAISRMVINKKFGEFHTLFGKHTLATDLIRSANQEKIVLPLSSLSVCLLQNPNKAIYAAWWRTWWEAAARLILGTPVRYTQPSVRCRSADLPRPDGPLSVELCSNARTMVRRCRFGNQTMLVAP